MVSALTNGLVGTTNIIITVTPKISLVNVIGNHHSITNGDITPSQSDHTDFGEVGVTTGSQSYVFTVQNTGTLALTVSSINIGDTDNYIFSGLSFPIDIIAGGSEDFNIEFNPTNEGIKNTTVIITNDSAANPYEFSITGEGIKPLMNVIGNSLNITNGATTPSISNHTDFGEVEITTGSQSYDFTIQNTGDIELIISSINVGDTGNYIFSGLSFPATINVGGSTNFNIKFDPATEGIKNTTVIITNDSTATPYKFSITGEGIKLSPNGWTIWWTNRFAGTTAPSILSSGTTDYSSTFSFDDIELCVGTNDILVSALTNGLVGTTNIIITVTPKISLVNVIGNHHSITNGDITPSQSDHTDFGEVGVTTGSQSYVFTVQNTGTLALTVSSINIGDTDNYIFSGLSFPIDIIAGGSEDFNIEFNPTNEGIKNTTVIITNDSAANPYEFSITGEGIKPLMNVIGNSLNITNGATTPSISNHTDFGEVEITTGSQSYDFTIQNTGDIELIISSINVGDTGNYIFSGLSFPATINVGGSTNFNIKFDPATEGIKNTTVIITNDSTATPYKFSITGEGIKLSPNGWTIWWTNRFAGTTAPSILSSGTTDYSSTFSFDDIELCVGTNDILVSALTNGLVGTTNIIITVTPGVSVPTISIANPNVATSQFAEVLFDGTYVLNGGVLSSIEAFVNGTPIAVAPPVGGVWSAGNITLKNGVNILQAIITLNNGNTSTDTITIVRGDDTVTSNAVPNITIENPNVATSQFAEVLFDGTYVLNGGVLSSIEAFVNGTPTAVAPPVGGVWSAGNITLIDGVNILQAIITLNNGNTSTDTITIVRGDDTVTSNAVPNITIENPNTATSQFAEVLFDGTYVLNGGVFSSIEAFVNGTPTAVAPPVGGVWSAGNITLKNGVNILQAIITLNNGNTSTDTITIVRGDDTVTSNAVPNITIENPNVATSQFAEVLFDGTYVLNGGVLSSIEAFVNGTPTAVAPPVGGVWSAGNMTLKNGENILQAIITLNNGNTSTDTITIVRGDDTVTSNAVPSISIENPNVATSQFANVLFNGIYELNDGVLSSIEAFVNGTPTAVAPPVGGVWSAGNMTLIDGVNILQAIITLNNGNTSTDTITIVRGDDTVTSNAVPSISIENPNVATSQFAEVLFNGTYVLNGGVLSSIEAFVNGTPTAVAPPVGGVWSAGNITLKNGVNILQAIITLNNGNTSTDTITIVRGDDTVTSNAVPNITIENPNVATSQFAEVLFNGIYELNDGVLSSIEAFVNGTPTAVAPPVGGVWSAGNITLIDGVNILQAIITLNNGNTSTDTITIVRGDDTVTSNAVPSISIENPNVATSQFANVLFNGIYELNDGVLSSIEAFVNGTPTAVAPPVGGVWSAGNMTLIDGVNILQAIITLNNGNTSTDTITIVRGDDTVTSNAVPSISIENPNVATSQFAEVLFDGTYVLNGGVFSSIEAFVNGTPTAVAPPVGGVWSAGNMTLIDGVNILQAIITLNNGNTSTDTITIVRGDDTVTSNAVPNITIENPNVATSQFAEVLFNGIYELNDGVLSSIEAFVNGTPTAVAPPVGGVWSAGNITLIDGVNILQAIITLNNGNTSTDTITIVRGDDTVTSNAVPSISIENPNVATSQFAEALFDGTYVLNGGVLSSIEAFVNGTPTAVAPPVGGVWSAGNMTLIDGVNILQAIITLNNGNTSTDTITIVRGDDTVTSNAVPSISIENPNVATSQFAEVLFNGTYVLNGGVLSSIEAFVNGTPTAVAPPVGGVWSAGNITLIDGVNILQAIITLNNGNTSTDTITIVRGDDTVTSNAVPNITIENPNVATSQFAEALFDGTYALNGGVLSSIEAFVNGTPTAVAPPVGGVWSAGNITLKNGVNILQAIITLNNGNTSTDTITIVRGDDTVTSNAVPNITIENPNVATSQFAEVLFDGTYVLNGGVFSSIEAFVNGTPIAVAPPVGGVWSAGNITLKNGVNILQAIITLNNGNTSTDTITIVRGDDTVTSNAVPSISIENPNVATSQFAEALFDGTYALNGGVLSSIEAFVNGTPTAVAPPVGGVWSAGNITLIDGVNILQAIITLNNGNTSTDTITIVRGDDTVTSNAVPSISIENPNVATSQFAEALFDGTYALNGGVLSSIEAFVNGTPTAVAPPVGGVWSAGNITLIDGVNILQAIITLNNGNTSTDTITIVRGDDTVTSNAVPSISIENPNVATSQFAEVLFDGTYVLNGGVFSSIEAFVNGTPIAVAPPVGGVWSAGNITLIDGVNILQAIITLNNGNTSTDTITIVRGDDTVTSNAVPNITIENPNVATSQFAEVLFNGIYELNDGVLSSIEAFVNGMPTAVAPPVGGVWSAGNMTLIDGVNILQAIITLNNGNTSTDTITIVRGDDTVTSNAVPNITIANPNVATSQFAEALFDGTYVLNGGVFSSIEAFVNGTPTAVAPPVGGVWSAGNMTLIDGVNILQAIITLNNGNTSTDTITIVRGDDTVTSNAVPNITIENPNVATSQFAEVLFNGTYVLNGGVLSSIEAFVNGTPTAVAPPVGGVWSAGNITLKNGENILQAIITLNNGNTSTDTITIVRGDDTVTSNAVPSISIENPNVATSQFAEALFDGTYVLNGGVLSSIEAFVNGTPTAVAPPAGGAWSAGNMTLKNGENILQAIITLNNGNTSTDTITIVRGDDTVTSNAVPSISIENPNTATSQFANVLFNGIYELNDGVLLSIEAFVNGTPTAVAPPAGGAWSARNITLIDGVNTLQVIITLNNGNTSTDTITIVRGDDTVTSNAVPNITIENPNVATSQFAEVLFNGTYVLNGGVLSSIEAFVNGTPTAVAPPVGGVWSAGNMTLIDGVNILQAIITLNNGNTSTDTITIVRGDDTVTSNAVPSISIENPNTATSQFANVLFNGIYELNDGVLSSIEAFVNGMPTAVAPPVGGVWSAGNMTLIDGVNILQAIITLNNGNTSTDTITIVRGDDTVTSNAVPNITIENPNVATSQFAEVLFDGTYVLNGGVFSSIEAFVNGTPTAVAPPVGGVWSAGNMTLKNGENILQAIITLNNGNTSTDTITIVRGDDTVTSNAVPNITIENPNVTTSQFAEVLFDGTYVLNGGVLSSIEAFVNGTPTAVAPPVGGVWSAGNITLIDGVNILQAIITLNNGNTSTDTITIVRGDDTVTSNAVPSISIENPNVATSQFAEALFDGTYVLNGGVLSSIEAFVNGTPTAVAPPVGGVWSAGNMTLIDGVNILQAIITLNNGNTSTDTITIVRGDDTVTSNAVPSISIENPNVATSQFAEVLFNGTYVLNGGVLSSIEAFVNGTPTAVAPPVGGVWSAGNITLIDGVNILQAIITLNNGNTSTDTITIVRGDDTVTSNAVPSISIENPNVATSQFAEALFDGTYALNGGVLSSIEAFVNGTPTAVAPPVGGVWSAGNITLKNGVNILQAIITLNNGNTSTDTITIVRGDDTVTSNAVPSISIENPNVATSQFAEVLFNGTYVLNGGVLSSIEAFVNGTPTAVAPPVGGVWSAGNITLKNGVNILQAIITLNNGNTSTDTITIVRGDDTVTSNAVPNITIENPNVATSQFAEALFDGTYVLNGGVLSSIEAFVNGTPTAVAPPAGGAWSAGNMTLKNGENILQAIITLNNGNTSTDTITIVRGDDTVTSNAVPSISIENPNTATSQFANVLFNGIYELNDGVLLSIEAFVNGTPTAVAPPAGGAWSARNITLIDGVNTLQVIITLNNGNTSTDTITIVRGDDTVTSNAVPNITIENPNVATSQFAEVLFNGIYELNDGVLSSVVAFVNNIEVAVTIGAEQTWDVGIVPLQLGQNKLKAIIALNNGNVATDTVSIIFYIPKIDLFKIELSNDYSRIILTWSNELFGVSVFAQSNKYFRPYGQWFLMASNQYNSYVHEDAGDYDSFYYRLGIGVIRSDYDVGKFNVRIKPGDEIADSYNLVSCPFELFAGNSDFNTVLGNQFTYETGSNFDVIEGQLNIGKVVKTSYCYFGNWNDFGSGLTEFQQGYSYKIARNKTHTNETFITFVGKIPENGTIVSNVITHGDSVADAYNYIGLPVPYMVTNFVLRGLVTPVVSNETTGSFDMIEGQKEDDIGGVIALTYFFDNMWTDFGSGLLNAVPGHGYVLIIDKSHIISETNVMMSIKSR